TEPRCEPSGGRSLLGDRGGCAAGARTPGPRGAGSGATTSGDGGRPDPRGTPAARAPDPCPPPGGERSGRCRTGSTRRAPARLPPGGVVAEPSHSVVAARTETRGVDRLPPGACSLSRGSEPALPARALSERGGRPGRGGGLPVAILGGAAARWRRGHSGPFP